MKAKIFTLAYALANLALMIYGWVVLLVPSTWMDTYSDRIYSFPAGAQTAINFQSGLFRLLGYYCLLVGIAGTIVLWRWTVNQGVWKLRSLVTLTTLAYLGPVIFVNTLGISGWVEIIEHIIFVCVILTALTMIPEMRAKAD